MLLPVLAVVALVGALAERTIRSLSAPPKIEPRFEHVSGQRPGPVREFALRDIHGALYTRDEWRGRPAIVLFFVTDQGLNWFDQRPEIERLIRKFSPRGCYFACIVADNGEKHASNAELFMADPALKLPVLLDREHQIAHQAGIRADTRVRRPECRWPDILSWADRRARRCRNPCAFANLAKPARIGFGSDPGRRDANRGSHPAR